MDDAASKEPDSAVGDVSARLETFEGKVFSGWIEKGIQKIFGIMTVYAETTENAAGSDIEKKSRFLPGKQRTMILRMFLMKRKEDRLKKKRQFRML